MELIDSDMELIHSQYESGCLRGHTLSDTENQIPIVKTCSRASVQARKHFLLAAQRAGEPALLHMKTACWGANTFT